MAVAAKTNKTEKSGEPTRTRILDAACRLFAEHGIERTTLRQITSSARCNLAAVNYHFRSKGELVAASIEQAVLPIIAARRKALEQALAVPDAISLIEALSRALVEPLYELSLGEYQNNMLLLMQLRPDAHKAYNAKVARLYKSLHEQFVAALVRALPQLTSDEIALRYDCARGAILQTLVALAPARGQVLRKVAQGKRFACHDKQKNALVAFVRGGFEASATL
jgi:AcrR family transcriptional regulator